MRQLRDSDRDQLPGRRRTVHYEHVNFETPPKNTRLFPQTLYVTGGPYVIWRDARDS